MFYEINETLNVMGMRQTEDLNRPDQRMVNQTKQTPGKLALTQNTYRT